MFVILSCLVVIFVFPTTLNKSFERKSFLEASQNPKWIEAMNLEMEALHMNNTYELVDLPPIRKAPRRWNEKLTTTLIENGFVQSKNDYYLLYVKSKNGLFIGILVYVDDIVITRNNEVEIDKFKRVLRYLKNASGAGVQFNKGKSLYAYSDVD
ncbi:ribonuclease H-like domain-containing protein [Tanacetum coccineum]